MEYQYPIDYTWSTDEIVQVINFFEKVELAYETGVSKEQIMESYRAFKKIVPSIAEEKRLFAEFEDVSNYSSYKVVQAMKNAEDNTKIRMR